VIASSDLAPSRPPCSIAEREAARAVASALRRCGLRPRTIPARAPTSPTWIPLLRALFRVWAAAFLAAQIPLGARILAGLSIAAGLPAIGGLVRFVPLVGATTHNVITSRHGTDRTARPIVVTAHLDTHSTAGRPMTRAHEFVAGLSGWLIFAAAIVGHTSGAWRPLTALVAAEAVVTLAWLARRELTTPSEIPDDNTSGLIALLRVAELVTESRPLHDVWIAATGAGTSGSYGLTAFLRRRRELRRAWVVEVDALGSGEVVASPFSAHFSHPATPDKLVRAIADASKASGDPLHVRRVRRPHSDARAALRLRTPAIALTAGLRQLATQQDGPDVANAERAARVIDRLVRTEAQQ
jgi:hypothetical protein